MLMLIVCLVSYSLVPQPAPCRGAFSEGPTFQSPFRAALHSALDLCCLAFFPGQSARIEAWVCPGRFHGGKTRHKNGLKKWGALLWDGTRSLVFIGHTGAYVAIQAPFILGETCLGVLKKSALFPAEKRGGCVFSMGFTLRILRASHGRSPWPAACQALGCNAHSMGSGSGGRLR